MALVLCGGIPFLGIGVIFMIWALTKGTDNINTAN